MKNTLKKDIKNATISTEVNTMENTENYIKKINKENQSLTKNEEIEIDEF